jgi:hypothetical protein
MVACPTTVANDTIVFNRCRFVEGVGSFQTPDPAKGVRGGDAIRIGGESTSRQTNWWCFQCTFDGFYRSGIAVQRGVYGVHVLSCLFRNTSAGTGSCLDFEGTGEDSDGECVIVGNRFEQRKGSNGVTMSGVCGPLPDYRTIFAHNICDDCTVHMADVDGLLIQGNMIVGDSHATGPALHIQGLGDNLRIVDNYLELTAAAVQSRVEIDHVFNITFSGNRVTYHGSAEGASGVHDVSTLVQACGSFCDNAFTAAFRDDSAMKIGAILVNSNRLHRCKWVLSTVRPLADWAAGPR